MPRQFRAHVRLGALGADMDYVLRHLLELSPADMTELSRSGGLG